MSTSSRILAFMTLLMVGFMGSAVEDRTGLVDQTEQLVNSPVNQNDVVVGGLKDQVGRLVGQVVGQHLAGCHLVLVATRDQSPVFSAMIRQLVRDGRNMIVVEAWRLYPSQQSARDQLLQGLWGDATLSCRAIIMNLDDISDIAVIFSFLEWCEVWRKPETHVVMVGVKEGVKALLLDESLRNTIHSLYLALHHLTVNNLYSRQERLLNVKHRKTLETRGEGEQVWVYGRCLYCNKGEAQVRLLHQGNLTSGLQHGVNLFPDQMKNFMGHTFRVLVLAQTALIDFQKGLEPGTPVPPKDSLNTRMIHSIASHLNFTYELREPLDGKWGTPLGDGNWTGIVGTLQHQQADFSLDLTVMYARSHVIDYSRIYSYDYYIILSRKPAPLPRYQALTRPFEGDLWMAVTVCTSILGIILWLLQKAWSRVSGQRGVRAVPAFLSSWGMMLLAPVPALPTNTSGQVLVGWWLLTCVIITTGYRSSLIAYLSVQSKYPPINTFQDLLNRDGWVWGSRKLRGSSFLYFDESSDPDIQEIFRKMEVHTNMTGFERLMEGGFSFIFLKRWTKVRVAKYYTDRRGNTPFYFSKNEYPVFGGNGWGFRRGAPFLRAINKAKQQLIEAGLLNLWLDEVLKNQKDLDGGKEFPLYTEESTGQVVLGLDHLQGAFYLLLLGCGVAQLTFLAEVFAVY